MKEIVLANNGMRVVVDDEDHSRLSEFRWNGFSRRPGDLQVVASSHCRKLILWREVLRNENVRRIRFANENNLDFRKSNLIPAGTLADGTVLCSACGTALAPNQGDTCYCAACTRQKESRRMPEYRVWWAIIQRCEYTKNKSYKDYGGRGIKVCRRWRESFACFMEDMGPRGDPSLTIDRIDNDGDYEPWNCQWVTRKVNNNNRVRKHAT